MRWIWKKKWVDHNKTNYGNIGGISEVTNKQRNYENCGPPSGNKFDLEKGQGHNMVPTERACHKDHACQISMLYL